MKIQELIEKIKANGEWFETNRYVKITKVIELVNQIDEPQKVKVPAFVAEYIIWCHSEGLTLWEVFKTIRGMPEKVWEWLKDEEHQAIFSKAYTDGYEVEEEQLYQVIINGDYLIKLFDNRNDHKFVGKEDLVIWLQSGYQLTEAEIKAIDERYWPFAVPAEKVEV